MTVESLRTPVARFEGLVDFSFATRYVDDLPDYSLFSTPTNAAPKPPASDCSWKPATNSTPANKAMS